MSQVFPLKIGRATIRRYTAGNGTNSFVLDFGHVLGKRLRIYRPPAS